MGKTQISGNNEGFFVVGTIWVFSVVMVLVRTSLRRDYHQEHRGDVEETTLGSGSDADVDEGRIFGVVSVDGLRSAVFEPLLYRKLYHQPKDSIWPLYQQDLAMPMNEDGHYQL